MTDDQINNVEEKKPIYKQKKGILGIVVVCCIGVLILAVIGGMLSPDSVSNTGSNSGSGDSSFSTENVFKDGTYKVGTDIPAGEYKFTQTSSIGGYVERSSDSSMEFDSIISNEATTEKGATVYVTINEGEYLKINGGELVKV